MKKKKLFMLALMAAVASTATITMASCDKKEDPTPSDPSTPDDPSKPSDPSTPSDPSKPNDPSTPSDPSTPDEKKLVSITATGGKTQYVVGEELTTYGISIVAEYSNGEKVDVTDKAKLDITKVDMTKVGSYKIVVKYETVTTTITINVASAPLASIIVDTDNVKIEYFIDDEFTSDGLVVTGVHTDESETEIEEGYTCVVTDSNGNVVDGKFTAIGEYTVTVTYESFETTYKVNVVKASYSDVEAAVEGIIASSVKTNAGTYNFNSYAVAASNTEYVPANESSISSTYTYGNSFVKTSMVTGSGEGAVNEDFYFSKNPDGSVLGVYVNNPGDNQTIQLFDNYATKNRYLDSNGNLDKNAANGQVFTKILEGTPITGLDNSSGYGADQFINYLYELYAYGVYGGSYDKKGICPHLDNEDGYLFGFNYIYNAGNSESNGTFYFKTVAVEFTLNDDGSLGKAYVTVTQYAPAEGLVTDLNNLPEGFDSITISKKNGKTIYEVKEDAPLAPYCEYKIIQTSGAKLTDDENPYSMDKIMLSSFKVYEKTADGRSEIQNEYNIDLDNGDIYLDDENRHKYTFKYEIDDLLPETANKDLDKIKVTCSGVGYDGTVIDENNQNSKYVYANVGSASLLFGMPGRYVLTFESYACKKEVVFNVDYEAPKSVGVLTYEQDVDNNFVKSETVEIYKSNTLYLRGVSYDAWGSITTMFDPNYTLSLPEGSKASIEKSTDKVNGYECYKFSAEEAGTYTVTITGAPDKDGKSATSTLTVVVKEDIDVATILAGEYTVKADGKNYNLAFTPEADGALNGTVTFTEADNAENTETLSYSYVNGKISLQHKTGSEFGYELEINTQFVLKVTKGNNSYTCYRVGQSPEDLANIAKLIKGTYQFTNTMVSSSYKLKFVPSEDGALSGKVTVSVTDSWDETTTNEYDYSYNTETKLISIDGCSDLNNYLKVDGNTIVYSLFNIVLEKVEVNVSEILSGKYTCTNSDATYTLEFKDEKLYVERVSSSTRTATYTYSYNESTGLVSVTRVEGKKSTYVENNLYIVDGTLVLKSQGGAVSTPCIKENAQETVVEINDTFVGTWINDDDEELIITKDSVTYFGYKASKIISCSENELVFKDSYNGDNVTLSLTNGVISDGNNTFKQPSTADQLGDFQGVWTSTNGSIITITENELSFYDNEGDEATKTTYSQYDISGNVITLSASGQMSLNLTISDDKTYITDDYYNVNFTKTETPVTPSEPETSLVPEKWQGTYKNSEYGNIVVESDSFTFGGDKYSVTGVTESKIQHVTGAWDDVSLIINEDGTISIDYMSSIKFTKTLGINKKFYGDWTASDGNVLSISDSAVKNNGFELSVVEVTDDTIVVDFGGSNKVTITYVNETTLFDNTGITYTLVAAPEKISEKFIGTWTSSGGTTIVISDDSITYNEETTTIKSISDAEIVFEYTDNTITLKYNSDGTLSDSLNSTYTKKSTDTPTETVSISTEFQGTWKSDSDIYVEINESSVVYNGSDADVVSCADGVLTFKLSGEVYTATISDGNLKVTHNTVDLVYSPVSVEK